MHSIYLLLLFAITSIALNVTAPKANEVIDISKPFNIIWTSDSTDPTQVSIDVVNATASQEYVLVNNVRGANVSEGNYTLRWANAIPSDTAAYQLVFLNYATGGYVAQSAVFNLTLPPGEVRNASTGNAPASPGTTVTESSSSGLSTGELAAAIVVPILAVIAIIAGAFYLWRRKRRQQPEVEEVGHRKAELDASGRTSYAPGPKTAELTADHARSETVSKHHSAELSGEKNLIKWELPSTPPSKPAAPIEMPAEVPLAEMGVNENVNPRNSENETTIAGSVSGEDKISPLISQNGFAGDGSLQSASGRSPVTPDVRSTHEETAVSTMGRSRFQEALYDIISDELRRPDATVTNQND